MKHRRLNALGLLIACAGLLIAGCGGATPAPTATPAGMLFRSDLTYVEAPLPPGWAASEGPQRLALHVSGLVSFNSWGQAGFWAPAITTNSENRYDAATVMQQMPVGGAYVALVAFAGPPALPDAYEPEYEPADLSGLWSGHDCRTSGGGSYQQSF